MIRLRRAPRHALSPQKLAKDTLWTLDVDDPIWSDRGLEGEDVVAPLWLSSDEVREGIRHMLTIKRCEEEECYLQREAYFYHSWIAREWTYLSNAIQMTGMLLHFSSHNLQLILHIL